MSEEYYISNNEEWFSDGPYPTREAAIAEGRAGYKDGFFLGRKGKSAKEIISKIDMAGEILEHVETQVYDEIASDDPVVELSSEQSAELNKLIFDFLVSKNAIRDTFAVVACEQIYPESEAE